MLAIFPLLVQLVVPGLPAAQSPEALGTPPGTAGMALHCLPRQNLLDHLTPSGGVPLFAGLINADMAIEVWRDARDPDDPWIAFLSRADGVACIIAHGKTISYADPASKPQPGTDQPSR